MRCLLLFLPLFLGYRLTGQLPQYHAQVFGAEYGIGGGSIQDICQDKEQFIWSTMNKRLQRFDGKNSRSFPFDVTLKSTICDAQNRIWTAGEFNVFRSRARQTAFEPVPFDTSGGLRVRALFQLSGQPVRLLSSRGLYTWQEAEKRFVRSGDPVPEVDFELKSLRFDTCGTTLVWANFTKVWTYDTRTGIARSLPCQNPSDVHALTPDLVVFNDYLGQSYWYDFVKQTVTPIKIEHYFPTLDKSLYFRFFGAVQVSPTEYLMPTRQGLMLYDRVQDKFTRQRVYAQGKPLEGEVGLGRLFLGAQGMYWAHLNTTLVAFTDLSHTLGLLRNHHYEGEQRWNNRVMGMAQEGEHNIWFGTGMGFTRLDLKNNRTRTFLPDPNATDRLNNDMVRGLLYDGKYIILGPISHGLWLFDPEKERYRRPVYASEAIRAASEREYMSGLYSLRNGDHLLFGSNHTFLLRGKSYRLELLPIQGERSGAFTACQDAQGRIWLGTGSGVSVLSENYEQFLGEVGVASEVFSLLALPDDRLLIGTTKSLYRLTLKNGDFQLDTIETPFEENMITMLYGDRRGRFWIGTLDGLYLGDAALRVFRKFDYADNIQGPIFSANSSLRAASGLLFIGGANGLNYLQPESFELEGTPLKVVLQSLDINNGDSVVTDLDPKIQLRHDQNMLAIEAIVPYFNNVGKVRYRYRVEGLTTEWIDNGNNNLIRLSGLPAGDYRLRVAASLTGKRWYESAQTVVFSISPPWWAGWLFRLSAFFSGTGLLFWAALSREKVLRQRQREMLEIEHLKTTALQYQLETEQVVNYFNTSIGGTNSVEAALWDAVKNCIARLGFEDCVIYLLDPQSNKLVQKAAWGVKSTGDDQIVNPIDIPLGQGIVGSVARSGEVTLIPDTTLDPRYIVDDAHRLSELAVPIILEGRVIGVIDSEHSRRNFYTNWHVHILTTVASLLANKIAVSRAEEARRQTLTDLLENQRKAAEAKLQSMRLQMSPHFLFNALNSIQQMILTGNEHSATLYLSKFSKLLRMVLTHSDREQVTLSEELDILRLYVALEALRFSEAFEYDIRCSPELDSDDYELPTLLIQPFVENAIWHGLLQKEGARSLRVLFYTNEEEDLICTVEDNGIGRAAAREYAERGGFRRDKHTGKGLSVSAERLQVHNSRTGQHNQLHIEDLYDADGRAAGTRVTIIFGGTANPACQPEQQPAAAPEPESITKH